MEYEDTRRGFHIELATYSDLGPDGFRKVSRGPHTFEERAAMKEMIDLRRIAKYALEEVGRPDLAYQVKSNWKGSVLPYIDLYLLSPEDGNLVIKAFYLAHKFVHKEVVLEQDFGGRTIWLCSKCEREGYPTELPRRK